MANADTSIGGSKRGFQTTQWSCILLAQNGSPDLRRRALEQLLRQYWKPVYVFVRTQWRFSNEDSKDLTQQFFAFMLEGEILDRVEKERGSFRTFLRTVLRNFLTNEYEARKALKKGGSRAIISLEEMERAEPDLRSTEENPEAAMDREWKRTVILHALESLRQEYAARGKETQYQVFAEYYFGKDRAGGHLELAARYQLSPASVNKILTEGRRRFRQHAYQRVAASVTDAEALRQEIRELFGSNAVL